jgi:arylformamidase
MRLKKGRSMSKDEIIDISWPITENMSTYKDSKIVAFKNNKNFESDGVRESDIRLNSHTGTHIDSPAHFLQDGKTVENITFDHLIGPCQILDFSNVDKKITALDLENHAITAGSRILLKTKNSLLLTNASFNKDFVYLDVSGAEYLVSKKINVVGIDYLGIERSQPGHETHKILFENEITIIEGLRLKVVSCGNYFLYCLPLAVRGLEAVPARAILVC